MYIDARCVVVDIHTIYIDEEATSFEYCNRHISDLDHFDRYVKFKYPGCVVERLTLALSQLNISTVTT